MKQTIIDASQLELTDKVVTIKRVTKTVKGGRNMRFTALVVVGDGNGHVGAGLGKAVEIPEAIRKGKEDAMKHIINDKCSGELDIRGVAHKGFFAPIDDLKGYYDANLALLDPKNVKSLFSEDWPIYTRTSDSCPTQYYETANVKSSFISNGCQIEGTFFSAASYFNVFL